MPGLFTPLVSKLGLITGASPLLEVNLLLTALAFASPVSGTEWVLTESTGEQLLFVFVGNTFFHPPTQLAVEG